MAVATYLSIPVSLGTRQWTNQWGPEGGARFSPAVSWPLARNAPLPGRGTFLAPLQRWIGAVCCNQLVWGSENLGITAGNEKKEGEVGKECM